MRARVTVSLCTGMSRDVSNSDYYRKAGQCLLPVRWMAPEALRTGKFTHASDTWAFGVCLYEIMTFGAIPYAAMTNTQVYEAVSTERYRLPHVMQERFPRKVYDVAHSCWALDPAGRPRPHAVHTALLHILQQHVDDSTEVDISRSDAGLSVAGLPASSVVSHDYVGLKETAGRKAVVELQRPAEDAPRSSADGVGLVKIPSAPLSRDAPIMAADATHGENGVAGAYYVNMAVGQDAPETEAAAAHINTATGQGTPEVAAPVYVNISVVETRFPSTATGDHEAIRVGENSNVFGSHEA